MGRDVVIFARSSGATDWSGHLADGFGEPDLADAIAIQIQLRKSLGRKPPIQDACLPFRP